MSLTIRKTKRNPWRWFGFREGPLGKIKAYKQRRRKPPLPRGGIGQARGFRTAAYGRHARGWAGWRHNNAELVVQRLMKRMRRRHLAERTRKNFAFEQPSFMKRIWRLMSAGRAGRSSVTDTSRTLVITDEHR